MPILRKAGKGTGFDHHAAEQQPVPDIVFRVFQELRFLLRVEPRQTVQQHLQNFQLVVQKARRIVTVNAIAGEKAVNRAVQTLFSVVQEEAEAQQLRENERLCFSVLSNYARVLRRWKVQYAAKAPDKRFVEACQKLDEAEYYLDILCAGDSHERAEVVSYLLVDALDAANCTSILDKFPQREMTVIGAKGVYLSGGEVQRIAIARAILKNANIVIMDEASAAADPENEYELQQAFQKLMSGKTVIMIAHRLSSIQNVDQILFVQNGKVVEQGTHNELMACNGRYKDFQDVYCKANQWRLA